MTSAWDTAGLLPVRPPDDLDDSDVIVTDWGTYWECGFSGWQMMLGWFAGPATLLRYPDEREQFSTVVTRDRAGRRQISRRPMTDEERRADALDVEEQLRARGLPVPPDGFRWFQLVPADGDGRDVRDAFFQVQRSLPERYDLDRETAYARAAVEQLYGLPVTAPPPIPPSAWEPEPVDEQTLASRRKEDSEAAALLPGPPGAVPILRCRNLQRSLPFYAALGFRGQELAGYAVLRHETTELHLSRTSDLAPGGCLIRVPDAGALWQSLNEQPTLGPLDETNPEMATFTVLDPDHNHLIFVSRR